MSNRRLFSVLVVLALAVVVVLAVNATSANMTTSTGAVALAQNSASQPAHAMALDPHERNPLLLAARARALVSNSQDDYFDRHPESLTAGKTMETITHYGPPGR